MRQTKIINGETAYIFTPVRHETGRRIKMWIKESWTPRGKLTRFRVTDAITGKTYGARTMDCSLPDCICDAEIYEYRKGKGGRK